MTGFNFNPNVGDVVVVNPPRTVALGPLEEYGSVYGYPKRKQTVFETDAQGVKTGATMGTVKEELVLGDGNKFMGRVYYARGLTGTKDTLDFFNTPESLLRAHGFNVVDGEAKDPVVADEVADVDQAQKAEAPDERQLAQRLVNELGALLDRLFK